MTTCEILREMQNEALDRLWIRQQRLQQHIKALESSANDPQSADAIRRSLDFLMIEKLRVDRQFAECFAAFVEDCQTDTTTQHSIETNRSKLEIVRC